MPTVNADTDSSSSSTRTHALAIVAATFSAACLTVLQWGLGTNHDAAWILISADRLSRGGEFGVDVIDVNPPLIWWMSMPAVVIARTLDLSPQYTWLAMVLSLIVVSVAMCVRRSSLSSLKVVLLTAILSVLPGYNFGQRDHLVAILLLPYIVGKRGGTRGQQWLGWTLAAVAVCLKPHYLIVPAALEVWHAVRTRDYKRTLSVLAVFASIGIAYLTIVLAVAPAYFTDVLPAARATYGAYDSMFERTLSRGGFIGLIVLLTLLTTRQFTRMPELALASCAALVAAILQGKGFYYHFIPALLFPAAGMALLVSRRSLITWSQRLRTVSLVALLAISSLIVGEVLPGVAQREGYVKPLRQALSEVAQPGATVIGLGTSPRTVHPAVLEGGFKWVGSSCCLFTLPANQHRLRSHDSYLAWQLEVLANDVLNNQPSVIVLDHRSPQLGLDGSFDYRWLLKVSPLREAMNEYSEVDGITGYVLLVREP